MTEKEYRKQQIRVSHFFARLPEHFFAKERTFSGVIASTPEPVRYTDRNTLSYQPISEGLLWGKLWDSAWIRLDGEIPAEWTGKDILFRINAGGEVLVFDDSGVPFYSLTNTSSLVRHYRKEYLQYSSNAEAGRFSIWMEVAANGIFGRECDPDHPGQRGEFGVVRTLRYGVFNRDVWNLRLDLEVLMGLLHFPKADGDFIIPDTPSFPAGSAREKQIMALLAQTVDFYRNDPANAAGCRTILREVLGIPAQASAMEVTAVGHAHIDTAWLWPVHESIRKCARTFASQLTLMEKYPDYVFGASQAQHYLFIKENYPELYEKIKVRVKEGRWEIQGGMWVECDCNLTGGESLIRQFLHGKNFFRREFGVDVKNLWLPDVFGYSATMPQIIKKCGCNRFLTQKISWSDTNKFPYHCFHWIGIDGTKMLTFFPPEDNYNAILSPDMLNYGVNNFSENDLIPEIISLFGVGDGGGGPKEEYIERGLRCADLEGCPKVKFGRADDFLERLGKYSDQLPSWHGELYLELHRGTLTTQGKVKKGNRQCEEMLIATEILYSRLPLEQYPAEELDRLWKLLLLNQFHDILPGSSIGRVYERTHREHREIMAGCNKLIQGTGKEKRDVLTLFNALGVPYSGLVELPQGWNGEQGNYIYVELSPFEARTIHKQKIMNEIEQVDGLVLENALIRYEFTPCGELRSVFDKEQKREILAGNGNRFSLYHDMPNHFDAWDIDDFYEKERLECRPENVRISTIAKGMLFQEIAFRFRLGNSEIEQVLRLCNYSRRLDFLTQVDWRESHRMLRVAFPTNLFHGKARYDIQYGFVERPIHRNTSWDRARFEVCMHKYMDLAESDYGVALLNDCKYGVAVRENVIDLNLLRSPAFPDETADKGIHTFTYAFLPHCGDFRNAGVQEQAANLNRPPLCIFGSISNNISPFSLENISGCAVIESVKKAENGNALIARIVERHGGKAQCRLRSSKTVFKCDMMEQNLQQLQSEILEFTPFEIKTIYMKAENHL